MTAKVNIDPAFTAQVDALQQNAQADHEALRSAEPQHWDMPDKREWDGSLFDLDGMKSPFRVTQAETEYAQALQTDDPGSPGDLGAASTQADWMATMERGFRQRHMSWSRAVALSAGRKYGHGHASGVFQRCAMQYVSDVIKCARTSQ